MTHKLIDHNREREKEFSTRAEAEEKKQDMIGLGADPSDLEIVSDASNGTTEVAQSDGGTTEVVETATADDLPDETPGVETDPLEWVPGDFVDTIDGTPTINRKGYDVIAHHYNISVTTEVLVSPTETEFEYAEVTATAITDDGVEYTAHGSAHVDRGDDSFLLLEMADTRAAKRATARASGVGMVAVEELQNSL